MNVVQYLCQGNVCNDSETMPPGQDENAEEKSTASVAVDAKGVLAMADGVQPNVETATLRMMVIGGGKNARRSLTE